MDFDSLPREDALELLRYFFIFERNDIRQSLEQRHFRTEAVVDGCELHTDGPAPTITSDFGICVMSSAPTLVMIRLLVHV